MLSSPVFAKPHLRSVSSPPLPRALDLRTRSSDTNYLRSPHPRFLRPVVSSGTSRAFCGSRAVGDSGPAGETLLRAFTFSFELSTLDLVSFCPSRSLRELRTKNSPPLHPGRAASLESALQNLANSSLQTASQRPPLHQNAKSRPLFSIHCALFCNYGGGGGPPLIFEFPISNFVFPAAISPLESALTTQLRVSPCFARKRPLASLLESTVTGSPFVTPLETTFTENMGEGVTDCRIS